MISFYWPGKAVPAWLEKFEFSGVSDGVPTACHAGFGVVFRRADGFHVYGVGTFIRVNLAGMKLKIAGQGGGVTYTDLRGTTRLLKRP